MSLHLVRVFLDGRRLFHGALRRKLPLRDVDEGYLAHCALAELFGDGAPHPFAIQGSEGNWLSLLGYVDASDAELRSQAQALASPDAWAACDWERFAAKPMPAEWSSGTRVSFRLRACPVRRMAHASATWREGAEVDAFLVRCQETPGLPVDRPGVYREWLGAEFERRGGARLVTAELEGFRRSRLLRRTQGADRVARSTERPDALFVGELEVTDGAAFNGLLARGIGRHRAFGFGMLLLTRTRA